MWLLSADVRQMLYGFSSVSDLFNICGLYWSPLCHILILRIKLDALNSRLLQVAIRRLNFPSPSIPLKMSNRHLKYPSNPQKTVQSLAICTKKRKKPLLIHCHIRKTPYLCTRFPKESTERDLWKTANKKKKTRQRCLKESSQAMSIPIETTNE